MSDIKKADAPAKKSGKTDAKADVIDPKATNPSNDPNRKDREGLSTATEPNSLQRVGQKVSRTGRGNGGGEMDPRGRPGLNTDLTGDTLGERKAVSPAETDVIWTNESKDRWGVGQPEFSELLAQRNKIADGQLQE